VSVETLTLDQMTALRDALRPFVESVLRVDLYGSRARGDHRPGSDIDLIVEGAQDDGEFAEISAALEDSMLSVPVSVMRYRDLGDTSLGITIARDARPLFYQNDLR
jgi:predicted nucleotidyltransferase